jgi:hypothetical protein
MFKKISYHLLNDDFIKLNDVFTITKNVTFNRFAYPKLIGY